MITKQRQIFFLLLSVTFLILSGCASDPVRHLSSDVCLIIPKMSTKQEVLSYIGQPDQRQTTEEGHEVWYYYESSKSLLRKTPYVGDNLGEEDFDLVTVTFTGNRVLTCVYRSLSEEEFKKTGLHESTPPVE